MSRRSQLQFGGASRLMEDEDLYFSKEKIFPRRESETNFCQKLGVVSLKRSHPVLMLIIAMLFFIAVVFMLHRLLSSLDGPVTVRTSSVFKQNSDFHDTHHNGEGGDIVFSYHNEEDTSYRYNTAIFKSNYPEKDCCEVTVTVTV